MNILETVDKFLENPYIKREPRKSTGFYPSQSSCVFINEYDEETIIGSCLRSNYWHINAIKPTNPMTARSRRITSYAKLVEQFEIEQYKKIGIWRGNNVKFYNTKYKISGEADAIVYDKGINSNIGVEIKTGYDYRFRKEVIGTQYRKGRPKLDHLLQTMLYIDWFDIPFKMLYIDRGNAARKEYAITLNRDGTCNIDGRKLANGLSIPRCIARYDELGEHLLNATLPKRDFQLKYSQDRIEFLYDSNRLNKTASKEFERNKKLDIGDWQCSYCNYKDYCWKEPKE